ncbi:MAG TPA: Crp/Fnr family transcriptional regulator [Solirubrobacteraceae bacterium]|nr:Crp/Fnr family transcriptional regulator [Solirubrobacteraceae bacterium]
MGPSHSNLIDLDPELGSLLAQHRLARAKAELRVEVMRLASGIWDSGETGFAPPATLALLVVDGVLARDVIMGSTRTTELVGPGDLLRPWEPLETPTLVPHVIEWTVLDAARIAVLDGDVSVRLAMYPEVGAVLFERMIARSRRLAIERAIAGLNRVEHRVVFLLWHLAERWGRVGPDGVLVPVTLSHRMIGQIISARRPTVSAAVSRLRESGELIRRQDGTWLLTGEPPILPAGGLERVLPRRRIFSHGA